VVTWFASTSLWCLQKSVPAAISVRTVAISANAQVPPVSAGASSGRIQCHDGTRNPTVDGLTVGILGGTGEQGRGLARRFAVAGNPVIIGSRSHDRAHGIAQEIGNHARGLANRDCAREADLVIAAVPWEGHRELLSGLAAELAGKIVVDCVNPLGFDKRGAYPLPVAEGSAAEQAAALLPDSRVVAAFHHVSAVLLLDPGVETIDMDVLVLGDDREATDTVQALAARIPAPAASTRAGCATAARSRP